MTDPKDIWLDSLHISPTYKRCLEGVPSRTSRFAQAREDVSHCFGSDLPIVILEPPHQECVVVEKKTWPPVCERGTKQCKGPHMLPEFCVLALLGNHTPIKEGDFSRLVVVSFSNKAVWDESCLTTVLKDVDWEKNAQDCEVW
jgi:hypothetical protein